MPAVILCCCLTQHPQHRHPFVAIGGTGVEGEAGVLSEGEALAGRVTPYTLDLVVLVERS